MATNSWLLLHWAVESNFLPLESGLVLVTCLTSRRLGKWGHMTSPPRSAGAFWSLETLSPVTQPPCCEEAWGCQREASMERGRGVRLRAAAKLPAHSQHRLDTRGNKSSLWGHFNSSKATPAGARGTQMPYPGRTFPNSHSKRLWAKWSCSFKPQT